MLENENIQLPPDYFLAEIEAMTHNASEANKIGEKSYAREAVKEVKRLRKQHLRPIRSVLPAPKTYRPKPTPPFSVEMLFREAECLRHNIATAFALGEMKYVERSRKELDRINKLLLKWSKK